MTYPNRNFAQTVSYATKAVEWALRIIVGSLVVWQVWFLWMGISNRCFLDENLLGPESRWMFYLTLAEALYVLVFCLWRLRLKNLEAYKKELLV